MIHVALLGPTYPWRGGIAHYVTMLARQLRADGHRVDLCGLRRSYPRWLYPGRSSHDPSRQPLVTPARAMIDPLLPWTWLQTSAWVAQQRPMLAILTWWVPYWLPHLLVMTWSLRRAGIPLVIDCQNVLPHEGGLAARVATRLALRQAEVCLVYSPTHRAELQALLPRMAWAELPFPPYHELVQPDLSRAAARGQLGLPLERQLALFFGFVRPYKGLPVLIDALKLVADDLPLDLIVAGEFWQNRAEIEAQIAALGLQTRVRIVDRYLPDDELKRYLAASDWVVLPYLQAVQSGVLAVAQAAQRPVIASRVGGLQEQIREGQTGYLVPPADPHALADCLRMCLHQARAKAMEPYLRQTDPTRAWRTISRALVELAVATPAERRVWARSYPV